MTPYKMVEPESPSKEAHLEAHHVLTGLKYFQDNPDRLTLLGDNWKIMMTRLMEEKDKVYNELK